MSYAYRPPWVEASFVPRSVRLSEPREVRYRGERFTPLSHCHFYGSDGDGRQTYNDTSYPWGCVCKITNPSGGTGSGALIGPRHILTASHVLDWNTDEADKIELHLAGTVASATVYDIAVWRFTEIRGGDPTYSTVDEDYAVLVVEERLGDRFGYLGTKTYDSGWDDLAAWHTMGYAFQPADGTFPVFQLYNRLNEDAADYGSGRAMTTDADACSGQSGSSMFGFWGNDPGAYVVAVMSATGGFALSGPENWCSGGTDLDRLVSIARNGDP